MPVRQDEYDRLSPNMVNAMPEPELLRIEICAAILNVSRTTCYLMVARGELPSIRLSQRGLRVPRRELNEWIERRLVSARPTSIEGTGSSG